MQQQIATRDFAPRWSCCCSWDHMGRLTSLRLQHLVGDELTQGKTWFPACVFLVADDLIEKFPFKT